MRVERRWYAYDGGGHVKRIVIERPGEGVETVTMQYNQRQELWLIRKYDTTENQQSEQYEHECTFVREYRYSGDGRQRYFIRERDPDTTAVVEDGDHWREYMGSACVKDLEIDHDGGSGGDPAFVPGVRWVHGVGLAGFVRPDGGSGEQRRFVHADMLGSTRLITDEAGDVVEAMADTAFGTAMGPDGILDGDDEPVGAIATRYGWCGGWGYDSDDLVDPSASDDLGIIHIGARWYDAKIGRFLQRDPIGLAGGLNSYAYCASDPLSALDPDGLMFGLVDLLASVRAQVEDVVKRTMPNARVAFHVAEDVVDKAMAVQDIYDAITNGMWFFDSKHGNFVALGDDAYVSVGRNGVIQHCDPASWRQNVWRNAKRWIPIGRRIPR